MNEFWVQFWPDVTATAAGVILGLPVALWINRLGLAAENRHAKSEALARLGHGIETLVVALEHNDRSLKELAANLGRDRVPFDAPLDTVAWDAAREEVVPFMKRPHLQRRIAFHFARVAAVERLVVIHSDLQRDHRGSDTIVREDVRSHLLREIQSLVDDGSTLSSNLQKVASER